MADIPGEKELRDARRRVVDFANALDRATGKVSTLEGSFREAVKTSEDLANQIDKLASKTERTAEESKKLSKLTMQFEKASSSANVLAKVVTEKLSRAFDQLGKKIIKAWTNLASSGIDKLEAGIKRVYEYTERWTRAMGEFRTRMGAASHQMAAASKIARQWEGTMHALTGQFGQGIPMVAEFAEGIQRALQDSDKSLAIFSLKVGRTFGLSAEQVGQMVRSMENLSETASDQKQFWGTIADQADKAGLNLGQFSQEIVHSREFLLRFGKAGQKVFVESAAYVRRLGVSLKSLEGFYDLTDTFEGATKAAARLNTTFGTVINSLDLMLEQNPAKRFEMVRQQLIAQGKDVKNLMPQEIKLISETIGLTVDETNAMLKSGQTFEAYQKQKQKSIDVERRVKDAMNKTALTMYSFSLAADRITVAIANAIRPFLKLIGLAGKGDKDFHSFSEVMESITARVIGFFNALGKNKQFQDFLGRMADGVKRVALWIGKQLAPDRIQKTIDRVVELFKSAWTWSKRVIAVWAGFKVMQGVGSIASSVNNLVALRKTLFETRANTLGMLSDRGIGVGTEGGADVAAGSVGSGRGFGRFLSSARGGRSMLASGLTAGLGGAAAGLVGVLSGEMTVSQGVGMAIGTALGGAVAGPLGAAVGGWLGKKGGELVGEMIDQIRDASGYAIKKMNEKLDEEQKRLEERKKKSFEQVHAEAATAELDKAKKDLQNLRSLREGSARGLGGKTDEGIRATAAYDKQIVELASHIGELEKKKRQTDFDLQQANLKLLEQRKKELAQREALDDLEKLMRTEQYKNAIEAAQKLGLGGDNQRAALKMLSNAPGEFQTDAARISKTLYPMAAGGIVNSPTRALIGENGPEAVIPLRAMARGRGVRNATKYGGESAQKLVNYAVKGGGGEQKVIVIEGGDVVLDGVKVGRQLARRLMVDSY
jgi:hypothetical protein